MAEIKNELSRIIEYHNTLLPECSRKHPAEIVSIIDKTVSDWDNGSFNFANYKSIHLKQNGQVRTVKQFEDWSTELFLCIYLKRCIDRAYKIKYPNRNDHMHLLFGLIRSLQDMKDFVIVKYDFKDFFNSISSEYVFYKYLNKSNLSRQQKHLLQQFTSACPFCFAGINTSNVMAEVISKDFDRTLTTALIGKGLIFSKRYVDDGILIFNKYVSKNELEEIVNNVINKVFYDVDISVTNKCTTALNPTKFTYVSKRVIDSNPGTSFDFNYLGYQFLLTSNNTPTRKRTAIRYGITQEKIQKYSKKLDDIVQEYKSDGNLELLRHKLRAFCSRTVYRRKRYSSMVWKVKGFTSNYNELRHHLGQLDADTERFLKNGVLDAFVRSNIPYPYFLCDESEESPYNLYGCMKRNRTLLFEENERIGINKVTLEKMCKQVNVPVTSKTYNAMVREYLIKLRVGH